MENTLIFASMKRSSIHKTIKIYYPDVSNIIV